MAELIVGGIHIHPVAAALVDGLHLLIAEINGDFLGPAEFFRRHGGGVGDALGQDGGERVGGAGELPGGLAHGGIAGVDLGEGRNIPIRLLEQVNDSCVAGFAAVSPAGVFHVLWFLTSIGGGD